MNMLSFIGLGSVSNESSDPIVYIPYTFMYPKEDAVYFEINGNGWLVMRNRTQHFFLVKIKGITLCTQLGLVALEVIELEAMPEFSRTNNGKSIVPIKKEQWSDTGFCIVEYQFNILSRPDLTFSRVQTIKFSSKPTKKKK